MKILPGTNFVQIVIVQAKKCVSRCRRPSSGTKREPELRCQHLQRCSIGKGMYLKFDVKRFEKSLYPIERHIFQAVLFHSLIHCSEKLHSFFREHIFY